MQDTNQQEKIKIHTLTDHFNFLFGMFLSIGSAAALVAMHAVSPITTAVTFCLTALISGGRMAAANMAETKLASLMGKITDKIFSRFTISASPHNLDRFDGFRDLPRVANYLSGRLGLKETPALRILDPDTEEEESKKSFRLASFLNAMIYAKGGGSYECLLTPKLLKHLTDEEEIAVVAHEIGHAASHHFTRKILVGLAPTAAQLAAACKLLSTSALHMELYAGVGAAVAAGIFIAKMPQETLSRTSKMRATLFCIHAAMLTVPAAMGHPEISSAWMTWSMSNMIKKFAVGNYARNAEFQADRLSGESTGNPISLSNALKIIERFNFKEMKLMDGVINPTESAYPKIVNDLTLSHPPTARRILALRTLHNKMKKRAAFE